MELVEFRVIDTTPTTVVYLALDRAFGRRVVVKVLPHWPAGSSPADELIKVRHLAARLSQRSQIGLIFDAAITNDGGAYLVMEYAEGGTAATLLHQSKRVAPDQVVTIGHGAAQALATAHGDGILHQAMSPENVLIDTDGAVRVADFGLNALLNPTIPGGVSRNEHVAPEIIAGGPASPAADVYAFGSTLYTLLEGRSPARRTKRDSISLIDKRKLAGDAPKPMTRGNSTLRSMISAALSHDPQDRPEAVALVRELAPLSMARPDAPTPQVLEFETGPIVALPFFEQRIAEADEASAAKRLAPLASMYSSSVAELVARRLERHRRRGIVFASVAAVAAFAAIAGGALYFGNDDNRVDAAVIPSSRQPALGNTSVPQVVSDPTSTTILRASSAPVVPAVPVEVPTATTSETSSSDGVIVQSTTVPKANSGVSTSTSTTSTTSTTPGRFTTPTTVKPTVIVTPTTSPAPQPTINEVAQPPVPRATATTTPIATTPIAAPPVATTPVATAALPRPTTPPVTSPPVTAPPITVPPVTAPRVTAPPVTAPPATAAPAPVVNPPSVGSISARSLGSGDASFVAPNGDRCADSKWQVSGPVSFAQRSDFNPAPPGCWSAAHQFDTTWGTYPDMVPGRYTITLTLRKNGLTSSNSTTFDMP